MSDLNIDFSQLPKPLPADSTDEAISQQPTMQSQPVVSDIGKAFSLDESQLPEPLPEEPTGAVQGDSRGTLADMGIAALHGAESAARETVKTAGDIALHTVVPPFMRDAVKDQMQHLSVPEMTSKPQTTIGKIESDLVRFGLGFLAGGTVIKGTSFAANLAKSAVGTGLVADAHAERLSNIIESYPSLANPITDYLAAKEDDSLAEGKFKASLEDILTNSVAQLAWKTFKVAKGAMSGKVNQAEASDMAEHLSKAGTKQAPVIDPAVKAEQARTAITPEWSPLKLSDEKAVAFKTELDKMLKDKSLEAKPTKEGAVNISHMESGPEVLNTVNKLSALIAPEMKAAGWTQSQTVQATRELADQLGMDTDALIGGLNALGKSADQIAPTVLAGRQMIQGLASNVFTSSQKALLTGEGKEAALAEIKRFTEVLSSFKSLQTGVARGLHTFGVKVGAHNIDELTAATAGKEGDDLLKVFAMSEGDPTTISKLAQAASTSGLRKAIDTHNEVWINALLSGPRTHVVNAASTSLNMLLQPLNLVVGGTVRREWSDVREGLALYAGMRQHFSDALSLAKKSFQIDSPILGGQQISETQHAITSINYGLDPESVFGQAVDYLGKGLRMPTRVLGSSDEFFKQLSYRSRVTAQAAREAMDLIRGGKLKPSELDQYMAERTAKAFDALGAGLDKEAMSYAERVTFTSDLKTETWLGNRSFGESLQTLASTHSILRGSILPFVRVPANLLRQTADYTPVAAVVRKQFWADINAGGQRKTEALGRISLGAMFWTGAAFLANDGSITGAAPSDPEIKSALLATGWQPYSVKVGDRYISYNRLDPFGAFLGLTADYVQISGHLPQKEQENFASIATLSLVNNLASKSYLRGLIDTLSVVGSQDEKKVDQWIRQRASSYVPSLVASLNPDREMHDVRSVMDAIYSKIPGYSSTVPAKRDFFGERINMPLHFPYSAFDPFSSTTDRKDAVRAEMARLATSDAQAQWSQPPHLQGNVDMLNFKNKSGQSAYDRFLELTGSITDASGRNLHKALEDRINTDAYKNSSDGDSWYSQSGRVLMLRSVHDQFKERAMNQLRREYPELSDALKMDKQNRLAVKRGREVRNPIEAIRAINE